MPDDEYTPDEQDGDMVSREHIRALEDKARRADELAAEVEILKRDNVFTTALSGVDHPGLSYFKDGYKGDLTAEAIREAATSAGFIAGTPQPPPTPQPTDQYRRIAEASTGASPAPTTDLSVGINNAQSTDEVMELMSSHINPKTGERFNTSWNTQ